MANVSIILPTYNRGHLLESAVNSVLQQTYRDFELLIIDDASTDNTSEIIQSLQDNRIKYIIHKTNKGVSAARNTGIRASTGQYIAFQDSDDEWFPEKLALQMQCFEQMPLETDVVYCDMYRIEENNIKNYYNSPDITMNRLADENSLNFHVNGLGIQTFLLKKSCFDEIGLFDERLPRFVDLDLFIRLSDKYEFYHIKEALVNYNATEGISTNVSAGIKAYKILLEKYYERIIKNKKFLANYYFRIGFMLCNLGDLVEGRKYLRSALATQLIHPKSIIIYILSLLGKDTYLYISKKYIGLRS